MRQRTIRRRSASLGYPSDISARSGRQTVAYSSTANNQIPIAVLAPWTATGHPAVSSLEACPTPARGLCRVIAPLRSGQASDNP